MADPWNLLADYSCKTGDICVVVCVCVLRDDVGWFVWSGDEA